jgi:hypothetical protein
MNECPGKAEPQTPVYFDGDAGKKARGSSFEPL